MIVARSDQAIEFLSGDVRERIAEKTLERGIAGLHFAVQIERDNRERAVLRQCARKRGVLGQFLLGSAALADVLRNDQHRVLAGKRDRSARHLDVENFSVLPVMPQMTHARR